MSPPLSPIDRWMLDPAIVHLNHGSFGACLREVFEAAQAWRARLEAAPMRFYVRDWQPELDRARAALAAFVHAPPERLAFVPNATTGVAIALHSTQLATGDEVLVTDHGYRAVDNQVRRLADARGLRITTIPLPLPFDADAFVHAVTRAITPRTRLAVLDHVTSPTALRLPIERVLPVLAARQVAVIVDGAHAPGQLALDVAALLDLGVTWYAGNHHKWLCAPKATGFLAVAAGAAAIPLVTSHGATAGYGPPNRLHAELDWSGTHDPAAHLTVPHAIEAVAAQGGGWPAVYARNHALALELRARVTDGLGGGAAISADDAIGAMAAIPIVVPAGRAPLALERALLELGWEVPIVDHPRGPFVRVSAHLYNHAGEGDALARQLAALGVRARARVSPA